MTTQHVVWLLFAWVFVNQAGVPIPVVPSLLAAGALAAHGGTSLGPIVVTVVAGALSADLVWYGLGRWRGTSALASVGRLFRRATRVVDSAERRFLAHQVAFLFASRFLPELNPIAAGMAGVAGLTLGRYVPIVATSALVWAAAVTGVGYALGSVMDPVPIPVHVGTLGLVAAVLAAVGLALRHRRRHAIVVLVLAALAVAGCAGGPDYKRPQIMEARSVRGHTFSAVSSARRAGELHEPTLVTAELFPNSLPGSSGIDPQSVSRSPHR
jgi:membrane protein DedA with SNARE-associated domain